MSFYLTIAFVIITIFALIIAAYKTGHQEILREIAFYLVVKAEREFGKGTGELKYAFVITWLYEKLPPLLKWLFTEKELDEIIEDSVQRLKDFLEKSKQNAAK